MVKIIKTFLIFSLFFSIAGSSISVLPKNIYVATNGNDSNAGTFFSPYLTINRARSASAPGDTIYVRGGIYSKIANINVSGTANSPIRYMAYPGETPIIDGNNYALAIGYGSMLYINANYIEVSGFEVRYSGGHGILMLGKNSVVSNNNVHHNREVGILVRGNYGIIQDNLVWSNAMSNVNGVNENIPTSPWAAGLVAGYNPYNSTLITVGAIVRRNKVYSNWGEGLSTFGSDGTVIEDNTIYDNWSNNAYIANATNVLFQSNLVYVTGAMPLATSFNAQAGIVMGDEVLIPKSHNNTVINNLVYGANQNFYWWKRTTSEYSSYGMNNYLIANNTFVDSISDRGNIVIRDGNHVNARFINNIILQENSFPIKSIASNLTVSNNVWSDSINPLLSMSYVVTAGELAGDWFTLLDGSPAIDAALVLPDVTMDYYNAVRNVPDIGAVESEFSIVTKTTTNTVTPTFTLMRTPTYTPTYTSTPTYTLIPTKTRTPTPLPTTTPQCFLVNKGRICYWSTP